MPEPTLADVIARLEVLGLELRALRAEMTAALAELRLDLSALREPVLDLGHIYPETSE